MTDSDKIVLKIIKKNLKRIKKDLRRIKKNLKHLKNVPTLPKSTFKNHDEFYAPAPPDGWVYNWKMHSVMGSEFHHHQERVKEGGWTPVPASRHPELMPPGYMGDHINKEGLVLYERQKQIDDFQIDRLQKTAQDLVVGMEENIGITSTGHFQRLPLEIKKTWDKISLNNEGEPNFYDPALADIHESRMQECVQNQKDIFKELTQDQKDVCKQMGWNEEEYLENWIYCKVKGKL